MGPELTIELTTPMSSDIKPIEAAEANVEAAEAKATKDSSSSESRKFHAQLILFLSLSQGLCTVYLFLKNFPISL